MNAWVSFSCRRGVPGLRLMPKETFTLLDHRMGSGHDPGDLDLLAVDQGGHLGRDLVLPVVALVHEVVEALALLLVLEATDPHVHALVLFTHETAEDDHAHLDLEGDDLLLHALDPLLALSRTNVVLPQLEEHGRLLAMRMVPDTRARVTATVLDPCRPPGKSQTPAALRRSRAIRGCADSPRADRCGPDPRSPGRRAGRPPRSGRRGRGGPWPPETSS